MTDLGVYDEDVKFAWDEASKLKQEFEQAAQELEGQIADRRSYAHHAEQDWHGRYASVFEHQHMSCTIGDAKELAAELRRCAKMLHELANLAREENHRRQLAREWKAKHDEWKHHHHGGALGAVHDFFAGDGEPKPPDLPEIKPQPFVASTPPTGERG